MAAFLQHETAGPFFIAPPVAHEEGTVIGEDMFRRLDRDDLAKPALVPRRQQIAIKRRIAQDQPDQQPVMAVARHQPRQFDRLVDGGDDGLFREYLVASLQPKPDMIEMQMVGRADHQQIVTARLHQLLSRGMAGAGRDAMFLKRGQSGGVGVEIAEDLEIGIHLLEHMPKVAKPIAKPDDANLHSTLFEEIIFLTEPNFPISGQENSVLLALYVTYFHVLRRVFHHQTVPRARSGSTRVTMPPLWNTTRSKRFETTQQ